MISVLVVAPYGPAFDEVIKMLAQLPKIQLIQNVSSFDCVPIVRKSGQAVIVGFIGSQEHLVKQMTMLKLLKEPIDAGDVQVVILTQVKESRVIERLKFYGCAEVIPAPVNAKGLLFKIERCVTKISNSQERKTSSGSRSTSGPRSSKTASGNQFMLVDPLALESDFWIAQKGGAKLINGRWAVRLGGPGPAIGRWMEIKSNSENYRCWEWSPTDPDGESLVKEEGAWIFKGSRIPEALDNVWLFTGQQTSLEFYYQGASYGAKFCVDKDGNLLLAKNSAVAEQMIPQLRATWIKGIRNTFKGQAGDEESQEENAQEERGVLHQVAPLTIESDCWIFPKGGAKFVGGRWTIRLKGPAPSMGRWFKIESDDDSEQHWQWIPTDPELDPFIKEEGAWVFSGLCPKFHENLWLFVSKEPELAFYYNNESYGEKISTNEQGELQIAAESPAAVRSAMAINASLSLDRRERLLVRGVANKAESVNVNEETATSVEKNRNKTLQLIDVTKSKKNAEMVVEETHDGFQYDLQAFGQPGGSWEYVGHGPQGLMWYLYVPMGKFTNSESNEISRFWIYLGPRKPKLLSDKKKWLFRQNEPKLNTRFKALPKPIQDYLNDLGYEQPTSNTQEVVRPKLEVPALVDEHISVEDELQAIGALSGPAAIQASSTSQPTLSALGVAFIISELVWRHDRSLKQVADKLCAYLSASYAGLRVELWGYHKDSWYCVGTDDGSDGRLTRLAETSKKGFQKINSQWFGAEAVVSTIDGNGGETLGVLAVSGNKAELIASDQFIEVCAVLNGLLLSWTQQKAA